MIKIKGLIKQIGEAAFIWVVGNGGSAATAEHLSNDLFSKGYPAICLNSNVSIMTMIANDFGYQHTFSKQLELYADFPDLLITISCSGTSPNIVKAIKTAKKMGLRVYEFPVFDGDRNYEKLENEHLQLVHKIKKAL